MLIVKNDNTDAHFNLALEEVLLKTAGDDVFMLWQNKKSVIVGKNQNTLTELDRAYAEDNGIQIARRLTGGGAVFHDMGNLNFTFIKRGAKEHFLDFGYFNRPIIALLRAEGIDAVTSERNDILVDGKKMSGNAQTIEKDAVLHHGTLMFDVDLDSLSRVLKPHPLKIQSKAVSSVKSRVVNLSERYHIDIGRFKSAAEALMRETYPGAKAVGVDHGALYEDAARLAKEKYRTDAWTFSMNPGYSISDVAYTGGGLIEVRMAVEDGRIAQIQFTGDFSGVYAVSALEEKLRGVPLCKKDVETALLLHNYTDYIRGIALEELSALIAL